MGSGQAEDEEEAGGKERPRRKHDPDKRLQGLACVAQALAWRAALESAATGKHTYALNGLESIVAADAQGPGRPARHDGTQER